MGSRVSHLPLDSAPLPLPYLGTRLVQVRAAGVHVLRHDDESQQVRGGEGAGVSAAGGIRDVGKSPFSIE